MAQERVNAIEIEVGVEQQDGPTSTFFESLSLLFCCRSLAVGLCLSPLPLVAIIVERRLLCKIQDLPSGFALATQKDSPSARAGDKNTHFQVHEPGQVGCPLTRRQLACSFESIDTAREFGRLTRQASRVREVEMEAGKLANGYTDTSEQQRASERVRQPSRVERNYTTETSQGRRISARACAFWSALEILFFDYSLASVVVVVVVWARARASSREDEQEVGLLLIVAGRIR